jgi:hypothetical protein
VDGLLIAMLVVAAVDLLVTLAFFGIFVWFATQQGA